MRFFCLLLLFGSVLLATPRVVTLSPAMTELLCQLGGRSLLVGRSSACDYPPDIVALPSAGDFASPNLERLLALQPTHLITNTLITPSITHTLEKQKIQVLLMPCNSVEEYLQCVQKLNETLKLKNNEVQRIEAQRRLLRQQPRLGKRAVVIVCTQPLLIAGEGTWVHEMLILAGFTSPDFQRNRGYFTPSAEWLLRENPELLITFKNNGPLSQCRGLRSLPAVKKNQILLFPDASLLQRPGPRWCQGVEQLRALYRQLTP